jgi:hypothetical protein
MISRNIDVIYARLNSDDYVNFERGLKQRKEKEEKGELVYDENYNNYDKDMKSIETLLLKYIKPLQDAYKPLEDKVQKLLQFLDEKNIIYSEQVRNINKKYFHSNASKLRTLAARSLQQNYDLPNSELPHEVVSAFNANVKDSERLPESKGGKYKKTNKTVRRRKNKKTKKQHKK